MRKSRVLVLLILLGFIVTLRIYSQYSEPGDMKFERSKIRKDYKDNMNQTSLIPTSKKSTFLQVEIHALGWRRSRSQERLFQSLLKSADLLNEEERTQLGSIPLFVHLDAGYFNESLSIAQALSWPLGPKYIRAREGSPRGIAKVFLLISTFFFSQKKHQSALPFFI